MIQLRKQTNCCLFVRNHMGDDMRKHIHTKITGWPRDYVGRHIDRPVWEVCTRNLRLTVCPEIVYAV